MSEEEFQAKLRKVVYRTSARDIGARAEESLKQSQHGINGSFSDHLLYAGMWRNNGLSSRVDVDRYIDGSKDWMDKLNCPFAPNMSEVVSGNSCLFGLLRLSNLLLALVGLVAIGLGVYATVLAKAFNWYNGTFIIFGFAMFIVALFGYKNRKHPYLMTIYLLLVLGVLVCLSGLTLGIIFYPEYANKIGSEAHANLIRYSLLGICGVALSCLLFGCWYRSSLSDAIFDQENKPLDVQRPLVTPKTDKVREDMYKKYPQLKEMHERGQS